MEDRTPLNIHILHPIPIYWHKAPGGSIMVHTYEVLVDIKEFADLTVNTCQSETTRYEVDAESTEKANGMARVMAKSDHPRGTEYDVRVTRLLR